MDQNVDSLRSDIVNGIHENHYDENFSIIQSNISLIISPPFNSIIGQSENEELKTLLFVIGMFQRIDINSPTLQAICLFSTRDRVIDIYKNYIDKFSKYFKVNFSLLIRKPPVKSDISKAQLILSLPVTLDQAINSGIDLSTVKLLIIDEAVDILQSKTLMNFNSFLLSTFCKIKSQILIFSSQSTQIISNLVKNFMAPTYFKEIKIHQNLTSNAKIEQSKKQISNEPIRINNKERKKYNKDSVSPTLISFSDPNVVKNFKFSEFWPLNKKFIVEFFPKKEVPVTFIKSENEEKLEEELSYHHQDIVIIDIEISNKTCIIEICSNQGVLIIQDNHNSEIIRNFIKTTPFFTKGKIQELTRYVNFNHKLEAIDINENYIIPKRYSTNTDHLISETLGEPCFNFRQRSMSRFNWSKNLTNTAVLYCSFKVASFYMLLPIVQSAPKMFIDIKSPIKTLTSCMIFYFKFYENEETKITFISDDKEDEDLIQPILESLFDNKAYVTGSQGEFYGYGTSKGILITRKQILPFEHINISIVKETIDINLINKFNNNKEDKRNNDFIELCIQLTNTLRSKIERPPDPKQRNIEFPKFSKYQSAAFDISIKNTDKETNVPQKEEQPIKSEHTIKIDDEEIRTNIYNKEEVAKSEKQTSKTNDEKIKTDMPKKEESTKPKEQTSKTENNEKIETNIPKKEEATESEKQTSKTENDEKIETNIPKKKEATESEKQTSKTNDKKITTDVPKKEEFTKPKEQAIKTENNEKIETNIPKKEEATESEKQTSKTNDEKIKTDMPKKEESTKPKEQAIKTENNEKIETNIPKKEYSTKPKEQSIKTENNEKIETNMPKKEEATESEKQTSKIENDEEIKTIMHKKEEVTNSNEQINKTENDEKIETNMPKKEEATESEKQASKTENDEEIKTIMPKKEESTKSKEQTSKIGNEESISPENHEHTKSEEQINLVEISQDPTLINFSDPNVVKNFKFSEFWPLNKKFIVEFFPKKEVPVTFIKSENEEKLEEELSYHHQDIVIIDTEISNKTCIIEICSNQGVLIIQDNHNSEIIRNFIKTTPFFTKGKIQELTRYVNFNHKLEAIDINENYIIPKRYPINADNLILAILGEPCYNFSPKSILKLNWSKKLTNTAVLYCSFKVASFYMLLPIVQSAPKMFIDIKSPIKTLTSCMIFHFKFYENEETKITFISDDKEDEDLIQPILESLFDNKSYVTGSQGEFYGYGTSKGILITRKQILPFEHINIPIVKETIDINLINKFNNNKEDKRNNDFIELCIQLSNTLRSKVERSPDPKQRNIEFPKFSKYQSATFDIPSDPKSQETQYKFTILPLPINPELYLHFSLPALESIQTIQNTGFSIPFSASFDIDEMCQKIKNDEISDELEEKIKKLIENFSKIQPNRLARLLDEIEPEEEEKDAYIKMVESSDFSSLSENEVDVLLSILNRVFKSRNDYLSQLASIESKYDKKDDLKAIIIELFISIQPSEQLVDQITRFLSQHEFRSEQFVNQLNIVLNHLKKMEIKKSDKDNLINLCDATVGNLIEFASKEIDCYDQILLIKKAFLNLKKFDPKKVSVEETNLFINDAIKMMNAVETYISFMNLQRSKPIRKIENLLFKMIFSPSESNSPSTQVYSVYQVHDKFLYNMDQFVNFKSSTGSGKTRCAPFFFSIKAYMDQMERPFFVMTQPGASIISDKMKDFKNVLGKHNVILVDKVDEMVNLYKQETPPSKPVVALFSLRNALRLLTSTEKLKIDITSNTRFCLDEIHERSVDTDVFIAKLSEKLKDKKTFPLHVLMMSATPDARVLDCFGKVNTLELPDSQLFPVMTVQKEVESKNQVINEAVYQTLEILNQMARGSKQLGHILVFTSGNARIKEFMSKFGDRIKNDGRNNSIPSAESDENILLTRDQSSETLIVPTVRNLRLIQNVSFESEKKFNQDIDGIIKGDKKTLFIIPIQFAGFVSNAQKEIAKNVIQKHQNAIKIIIATNAIESSITIDQLSAVVDTGIFNQPRFDTQRGLTQLSEESISIQSQTQRKGRVGRVRPGISVQISIKGLPFKQFLPPDIQVTDISSNILSLRKIGIKLELIKNLPDPIDPQNLNQFMDELYTIGAINKNTGELTEKGNKISKFESLSPFLVASIIQATSSYKENTTLLEVLGSLIVLIFNSSDIVVDRFAQSLQNNFNEDSDIITLLKTFLDLVCTKSWMLKAEKFGLNSKIAKSIFSSINTISENLKVPTNEKHVYLQLQEIANKIDLMDFIQKIINNIEVFKPSWIQCRIVTFLTIDYIRSDPSLIYKGDRSLMFSTDTEYSEISISARPGSKGFISPGSAYIFDIRHNESTTTNYGSCIHRNLKLDPIVEDSYKFVKPKAIEADISLYAQDEFSSCILNAFLQGRENEFVSFNAKKHSEKENEKVTPDATKPLKHKVKEKIIFYITIFKEKSVITYAPLNKQIDTEFQKAVEKISILLPFTPSAILIKHPLLNCAIATQFSSIDKPNSTVHFFKDNDYYPYQINKKSLNYLINNIDKLKSIENSIFIAITGEMLSIPLESSNSINFNKIRRPTIDQECDYVFSDDPFYFSHLVILTKNKILYQKPIPWTKNAIYPDYEISDYMIKVANSIFPDFLNITKCDRRAIFILNHKKNARNRNYSLKIQKSNSDKKELLPLDEIGSKPINTMFDRYIRDCFAGNKLVKNVKLESFECNGPRLPPIFCHNRELNNFIQKISKKEYEAIFQKQIPTDFSMTTERRAQLENRKSEIIQRQIDLGSIYKSAINKAPIIQEQKELKEEREKIESELKILKEFIDYLKTQPRIKQDVKVEEILKIPSALHYDIAQKIVEKDYHISFINKRREIALEIPEKIDENEKEEYIKDFLEIIQPLNPNDTYIWDELPVYKLTLNHGSNLLVDIKDFEYSIKKVCDRFGAIISSISKIYESHSNDQTYDSHLNVFMYFHNYIIPFANLAIEAIYGHNYSVLHIPRNLNIDPISLINNKQMHDTMMKWLNKNKLKIYPSKNKWIGSQHNVERALELLNQSPPQFPIKIFPIPGGIDIIRLNAAIKRQTKIGKKKWYLNLMTKTLTVPSYTESDEVKKFIDRFKNYGNSNNDDENVDDLEYIGDVSYCCEDAPLSTKLVNVYKEDGTVQTKNFCRRCIRDSLVYALGRMYDENTDTPIMNRIFDNNDFINPISLLFSQEENPFIPMGQLIWSFIFDSDIATPARTYVTALALQTLKKSPYITFCPEHPTILYKKPQDDSLECIVSDCQNHYCISCKKWHPYGKCPKKTPVPLGCRVCPNCHTIIEKSEACNHISCSCGKHFCYYCGEGPWDDSDLCYAHMTNEHEGCFNDPPDYRRYIQKITTVTDQELEEFYTKYKKLRHLEV